ncbi:hypothetical protein [Actinacidiphila rubida]|nr:hypothetical protein [Actinacidiphila rubida]
MKALVAATAAFAAALGGGLVMATSANATAPNVCRSDTKGDLAPIATNLKIDSCYREWTDGTVSSVFGFANSTGLTVTYCAHAIDALNPGGPWAWDFGCSTPTPASNGTANPGTYYAPPNGGQTFAPPTGDPYVISAGAWVNGTYVGDVESPRFY